MFENRIKLLLVTVPFNGRSWADPCGQLSCSEFEKRWGRLIGQLELILRFSSVTSHGRSTAAKLLFFFQIVVKEFVHDLRSAFR